MPLRSFGVAMGLGYDSRGYIWFLAMVEGDRWQVVGLRNSLTKIVIHTQVWVSATAADIVIKDQCGIFYRFTSCNLAVPCTTQSSLLPPNSVYWQLYLRELHWFSTPYCSNKAWGIQIITATSDHTVRACFTPWHQGCLLVATWQKCIPDSWIHGANMGPIWDRQGPGGPHVGPMNFAIWDVALSDPKTC